MPTGVYKKSEAHKGALRKAAIRQWKEGRGVSHSMKKGSGSPFWLGEKAGKSAKHKWVEKNLGKPSICQMCHRTEVPKGKYGWFQWANISGRYLRNLEDWLRLCIPCHRRFDEESYNKSKKRVTNKSGYKNIDYRKDRKKWRVQVVFRGKTYFIGNFSTLGKAIVMRDLRIKEIYGE